MTEGWHLRPAVAAELPALAGIFKRAARANPGDRAFLDANPHALELDRERLADFIVATSLDGEAVGFAGCRDHPDGRSEIAELFVDPSHWRRGIGRMLLSHLSSEAGDRPLFAVANPAAAPLYATCGFVRSGSTPVKTGLAPVFALDAATAEVVP